MHPSTKYIALYLLPWLGATLQAQTPQSLYDDAYSQVESMLSEKDSLDFKKAVFLTDSIPVETENGIVIHTPFIHLDALRNGIYMDTLSQKQSVALCLVDLAQGYQAKFGIGDGSFILKCCDTALLFFPNYINALLLKAEIMADLYKQSSSGSKENKERLAQMNELLSHIHQLGYRKMPQNMYLNWLNSMGLQTVNYRMKSLLVPKNEVNN